LATVADGTVRDPMVRSVVSPPRQRAWLHVEGLPGPFNAYYSIATPVVRLAPFARLLTASPADDPDAARREGRASA
jgi:hypothetical protein